MSAAKIIRCSACNSALDVEMNRAYIFCKYCGCKNIIEDEQIKTNINVQGVTFSAKTDTDSIISSAQYAITMKQYDKANELIMASILSGTDDYRIYSMITDHSFRLLMSFADSKPIRDRTEKLPMR